jgi:hypothetical protein
MPRLSSMRTLVGKVSVTNDNHWQFITGTSKEMVHHKAVFKIQSYFPVKARQDTEGSRRLKTTQLWLNENNIINYFRRRKRTIK